MPLHDALKGHGTFVYSAQSVLERYKNHLGPSHGVVNAFRTMGFTHAWVRLFGATGNAAHGPTLELIEKLREGDIRLAGWGYCHGADWQADRDRSLEQSDRYGLTAFVADVEPGNSTSIGKTIWDREDFERFCHAISDHFGKLETAVSTWPVPKIQDAYDSVALMKIASPFVGAFAPQAYWMTFPKTVHYQATGFTEEKYPRASPEAFVRLVIDAWRAMGIQNPLIVTGQAYWGEGGPGRTAMEAKMARFVETFAGWDRIVAFNWWHAGGADVSAMSRPMIDTLHEAQLDDKSYADA